MLCSEFCKVHLVRLAVEWTDLINNYPGKHPYKALYCVVLHLSPSGFNRVYNVIFSWYAPHFSSVMSMLFKLDSMDNKHLFAWNG